MNATSTPMSEKQREYIRHLIISERARITRAQAQQQSEHDQHIAATQVAFWTAVLEKTDTVELSSKAASMIIDSLQTPASFMFNVVSKARETGASNWIDTAFVNAEYDMLISPRGRCYFVTNDGIMR